ncbi:hypothetical protein I5907_10210 [Panacibacter sp. DH6]|uniref:Uncharacterized protein n=1 Tax=Panacibacter microcysteis TaxID=2793269 RepID=A0A931E7I9_9BACT|nr:hypothetical protein [Panacibacter microcysteis]MBG9376609.1 hypothetical protein [Panacibacter microcysteis]
MKTSTSIQKTFAFAICVASSSFMLTSCQKNNFKEEVPPAVAAEQSDELSAKSAMQGLFVSAADTAASVDNLYKYGLLNYQTVLMSQFTTGAKDGNGVLYNKKTDEVFQLSRQKKTLYVFANGSDMSNPPTLVRSFTDTSLSSGRELAYDKKNDVLFIANNTDSTIRLYRNFNNLSGNVTGEKVKISGQPWGIIYDEMMDKLVVVIDLAAMRLDIFDNPAMLHTGNAAASRSLDIKDRPNGTFSRLHGITYNAEADVLIVTEIGEAAAPVTPTPGKPAFNADGGIYVINNGAAKLSSGGSVYADAVIYGANTGLGNPVDVASRWLNGKGFIFAIEKANKKIQAFRITDMGDVMPVTTVTTPYSPEAGDLTK